jgi:hypothetical protein
MEVRGCGLAARTCTTRRAERRVHRKQWEGAWPVGAVGVHAMRST